MSKATDNTPEADIRGPDKDIISRWVNGQKPSEIAQETGWPVDKVYRLLKKFERAIIKEIEEI